MAANPFDTFLATIAPWVWLFFTMGVYSYFLSGKSNPWFKLAQMSALAVAIGSIFNNALYTIYRVAITPLPRGDLTWLVPIALGLILFAQFYKKYDYLRRTPMAFVAGTALCVALKGYTVTWVGPAIGQFTTSIIGGPITPLDNIITIILGIVGMFYFVYIIEHKGTFGAITKTSRYVVMVCLGVLAALTIIVRISQFIGTWKIIVRMFIPAP